MFAPILKNTLRYRSVFSLNDPYDCYIAIKNNERIQSIRNVEMKNVFVCSMTKKPDDLLMWSHYGSCHAGYVVEYDVEKLKSISEKQIEFFSDIKYSNGIIQYNFLNFSKQEKIILEAIFHKASCWCYEDEVRSVYWFFKI